ncbi:MAG: lipoprotein signal peptidase [Sodalis sp. Fse]|nr:MAG: lipoprotein signal peptidase [Sodalis sp. Fse]UVK78648.1 MAG: lipoprotein signal peptidase [Sodalis sp. Ffu]
MNKKLTSTGLRWLWLTMVVLSLDLSSKQWVTTHCLLGESVPIIPFINFFYAHNPGAAFSFLGDKVGWQRWAFALIAIVISLVLLVMMYYSSYRARLSNAAYAMIIGGALGNLFDRIVHCVVIDFIDFYIGNWHWPIFNVADSAICIGAALIMLENFFHTDDKVSKQKN